MTTQFEKLTGTWNAEPNVPMPTVRVEGGDVLLSVLANPWQFPGFIEGERIELRFTDASRYRLGATNDEGWHRGDCRFSRIAPGWGEFYELVGDWKIDLASGWKTLRATQIDDRHFLFYLRDETFECTARDWSMERIPCPADKGA